MNPTLVLIAPAYNEAEFLPEFCHEWHEMLKEINHLIIIVDDGSTDNTPAVMADLLKEIPELRHLRKPNGGHGDACRSGYDTAIDYGAEYILQIDSDGQCSPAYFPQFWENRHHDCVIGDRIRRNDGMLRSITSKICQIGSSIVTKTKLIDPNCPYRLIKRDVLAVALNYVPKEFNIQNVALTWALAQNESNTCKRIPIQFLERSKGKNSINLIQVISMGCQMLEELNQLQKECKKPN